jgi:thiamine biosynthesis lipoprotein
VIASETWPALGSTASVFVTDAGAIRAARELLEFELERIDASCSRFRDDSELTRANARAGEWVPVSGPFLEAVETALRVAVATDGEVDPTVGRAVRSIGYDRDFARLPVQIVAQAPRPVTPGWRSVGVDRESGTVCVPAGAELDLGATAKALAADHAADDMHAELRCGVLVSLGGDIAAAGPAPPGGWRVRVCDDHGSADASPADTVAISAGGLATSSTTVRRWSAGGRAFHHIVDPRTGTSAPEVWRTVSVAARSCVEANAASTAAIVRGARAPAWLRELGLPSRLVGGDGCVLRIAGWPEGETA